MRVLIWKDKHGDVMYDASTQELLERASLDILEARLRQGYLDYPDDAEQRAETLLGWNDGGGAYTMLSARSYEGFEYEGISVREVLTPKERD